MDSYIDFIVAHIGNWFVLAFVAFVLFVIIMKSDRIDRTDGSRARAQTFRRASKLGAGSAVAFNGEAGYQAQLMMPGIQFKTWPLYDVTRHPMVQIPAGQIGVVIAQVGASLPVGAKSGVYKAGVRKLPGPRDIREWRRAERRAAPGAAARQRRADPSGRAFLVITKDTVYGVPIDEAYATLERKGGLKPAILRPRRRSSLKSFASNRASSRAARSST